VTAPYDAVNSVRLAAEVRLNGLVNTLQPISGRIVKNDQAFSQQVFNNAFRRFQEALANLKYTGLQQETTFPAFPAALSKDPLTQVTLGFYGYTDSYNGNLSPTPALPANMIRPYQIWERISGSVALLTEVDILTDALPKIPKGPWNRQCQWLDDALLLPGALQTTDIAMLYGAYIPDFADVSANPGQNQVIGPWYLQPVPILRCQDPLADFICREIFYARGDMDAVAAIEAMAQASTRQLAARDATEPESIYKSSEFGKMRDPYTPTEGGPRSQMVRR
jgi:hypothetical protein